jgi:hypothetical protein
MLAPMPAPVRRLRLVVALVPLALSATLAGCAGIGQPAPYDSPGINGLVIPTPTPAPADFVAAVDNPWLPLEPGATWRYDVTRDGAGGGTIETEVVDGTTVVAGLTATAVRTTTRIGGGSADETRFYAQDDDGNVWLVGADAADGTSWRAGEGGAEAGLAMPADPRLGDGWLTSVVPGTPESSTTIEEQSRQMVQVRSEAGSSTRVVYAEGTGPVSIEDLDAGWQALLDQG